MTKVPHVRLAQGDSAFASGVPDRPARSIRSIAELDGLRALASALVFCVHFSAELHKIISDRWLLTQLERLAQVGYLGVEVFFVLSGYLVYGAAMSRRDTTSMFLRKRALKVLPAFWFVLLTYVVIGLLFPQFSKLHGPRQAQLLLENALLLPGVYDIQAIVTVAWSLSYEAHFYAALAVVMGTTGFRDLPARCRVALIVIVMLALVLFGSTLNYRLGFFALFGPGMLAWELTSARIDRPLKSGPAMGLVAVVFAGLVVRGLVVTDSTVMGSPLAVGGPFPAVASLVLIGLPTACLIRRVTGGDSSVRSWLGHAWPVFLGRQSYSFYLCHGAALHLLTIVLLSLNGATWRAPLLVAVGLPFAFSFAVLVAHVLHRVIEEPFTRGNGRFVIQQSFPRHGRRS